MRLNGIVNRTNGILMQLRSRTNSTRVVDTASLAVGDSAATAVAVEKRVRMKQEPSAGSKRAAIKTKAPRPLKKTIKTEIKQEPIADDAEHQQENAGDAANSTDSKETSKIKPEIQQVKEMVKPKNWEQVLAGIQVMRSRQDADVDVNGCEVESPFDRATGLCLTELAACADVLRVDVWTSRGSVPRAHSRHAQQSDERPSERSCYGAIDCSWYESACS